MWHYSLGAKEMLAILTNFLNFIPRLFSLGFLLRTLFSPWQRLADQPGKITDPENFFSTILTNTIMRIIGFFVRGITLVAGGLLWIISAILFSVVYVLWFVLPPFIAASMFWSVMILIF